MSKFSLERWKYVISFLIVASIFFVILIINNNTPLWSDDWAFHVAYGEKRVQSIPDVFSSVSYFYLNVNGRSIANLVVEIFVLLGKNIFNLFNALMFVALGAVVYFFANDDKKIKPLGLVGVFLLLWLGLPAPNQTLFWQCGSVVYLWMTVLVLLFLLSYKKLLIEKEDVFTGKHIAVSVILMFVFGFLAGNSHEILAPIVLLLTLLASFIFLRQKLAMPRWCLAGSVGVFLGLATQIMAPGNFVKLSGGGQGVNFWVTLFGRLVKTAPDALDHQKLLWTIIGLIICIHLAKKLYFKKGKRVIDELMIISLVSALILNFMSVAFPYFPPRAYFFSSIFLIIFAGRFLLQNHFLKTKSLIVLLLVPSFVFSAWTTIVESKALQEEYLKREVSISVQKSSGSRDIVVEKIRKVKNERLLNDALIPKGDINLWASRFYGVDSIKIK